MTDGEILESTDTARLRMVHDEHAESPRKSYEHLSHAATLRRQWLDVDTDAGPYAGAWDYFSCRYSGRYDGVELFQRFVAMLGGVTQLHTPHDGPTVVFYLTREAIDREGVDPVPYLAGEVAEYAAWHEGDTYGYVIEQRITWDERDGDRSLETWEVDDSCWGLYGYDYAVEAAREAWADYHGPAPESVQPATRRPDDGG